MEIWIYGYVYLREDGLLAECHIPGQHLTPFGAEPVCLHFCRLPSGLFCFSSSPKGVIFQTNKDGSLPPHVMYKIRQNSSFTERTNEIRRAYWRPGPNNGGHFYFLYGFVWIQGEPSWLLQGLKRWSLFLSQVLPRCVLRL